MSSALRQLLVLCLIATLAHLAGSNAVVKTPWYFDCSNHPEWSAFRERFAAFRHHFASPDRDDAAIVTEVQEILTQANDLGRRFEPTFVKYASDWTVFHLCNPERLSEVPEELQSNFCFYGFATVQWLGIFGHQHFGNVPGMAEWSHNARGFLNDASKFNAMHFLESSGWHVKMVEMAKSLSSAFVGHSGYRVSRDAALPIALSKPGLSFRRSPEHTRVPEVRHLRAVAISYHTALIREPLSLWLRILPHLFEVEATVHVLDASAKTTEDVAQLHSHCRFIDGAWCMTDHRLLQLNELFESIVLSCHTGDHKTRHHFIASSELYYKRFVDIMGNDQGLRSADFFMCGEPVLFCRLLSHFGRPVIGYISTPISVYVNKDDRPQWYQQFYDMALDGRHIFATTTPIFAEWVAYATGISLPVVRPVCAYTEARYWPMRSREVLMLRTVSLFWDTECVLNYFAREYARTRPDNDALTFRESTSLTGKERVGYNAFAEFLATVIYPYAVSQFWFYELYAMAVPLYMPSRDTLPLYVSQDYAVCPDFEGHRPGHAPHRVHPHSPFDTDDWAAMTYWTNFTDYLTLPHISHFDSVPHLLQKLEANDHREISKAMQKTHVEILGAAATFWSDSLKRVAAFDGTSAEGSSRQEEVVTEDWQADASSIPDELRDLSTRQPCGGSAARPDGPHRLANDGETRQDHPHQYHFDAFAVDRGAGSLGSHWWVRLRRQALDPEVKIWVRDCCSEAFGHRLWVLLGNSSDLAEARECGMIDVTDNAQLSTACIGVGEYLFVEARTTGGWNYQDDNTAVLMLPEIRVLSRD